MYNREEQVDDLSGKLIYTMNCLTKVIIDTELSLYQVKDLARAVSDLSCAYANIQPPVVEDDEEEE